MIISAKRTYRMNFQMFIIYIIKRYLSLLQLISYALEFALISPSVIMELQWLEFLMMRAFLFHARVNIDAHSWNSNILHLHGPLCGYKRIYKYMRSATFLWTIYLYDKPLKRGPWTKRRRAVVVAKNLPSGEHPPPSIPGYMSDWDGRCVKRLEALCHVCYSLTGGRGGCYHHSCKPWYNTQVDWSYVHV